LIEREKPAQFRPKTKPNRKIHHQPLQISVDKNHPLCPQCWNEERDKFEAEKRKNTMKEIEEITLNEMIIELDRELVMRERVYSRQVLEGRMNQNTATFRINTMKAIRQAVEHLKKDEKLPLFQ
jgi:hypothetical protein